MIALSLLFLLLLSPIGAFILLHLRSLQDAEVNQLAQQRRKKAVKRYFRFNSTRLVMNAEGKKRWSIDGKLLQADEPLERFPSVIAALLKYKKHEWIVIGFEKSRVIKQFWINKGDNRESVASLLGFPEIVQIVREGGYSSVIKLHNHPNPDPQHYSHLIASKQDLVVARSLGNLLSDCGANLIEFVCERGSFLEYSRLISDSFTPVGFFAEGINVTNGKSKWGNLRLHIERIFSLGAGADTRPLPSQSANEFDRNASQGQVAPAPVINSSHQEKHLAVILPDRERAAEAITLTRAGGSDQGQKKDQAVNELVKVFKSALENKAKVRSERTAIGEKLKKSQDLLKKREQSVIGRHFQKTELTELRAQTQRLSDSLSEFNRNNKEPKVNLGFDENLRKLFAKMVPMYSELVSSEGIWKIMHSELKGIMNNGAELVELDKRRVVLDSAEPELVEGNCKPFHLQCFAGKDIYIYPSFVLTCEPRYDDGRFEITDLREVEVTYQGVLYAMRDPIPGDSYINRQFWAHANKDGSAKKGIPHNYLIKELLFGILALKGKHGLNEMFMFSSADHVLRFQNAMKIYIDWLRSAETSAYMKT